MLQPPRTNNSYVRTVILLSVVVMIYQGISNSNLGVISQFTHQKGDDWAGPLSQSLLFLGLGLGSLNHSYIGKYSYKSCLFVGSFGNTLYIALGLVFIKVGFTSLVQASVYVSSFISGLVVSIFYIT